MKSIFITGGANGIGFATAQHFAKKGWRVGIGDLAPPAELPQGASFHLLDVRNRDQWQAALDTFVGADGLDILVNNAGIVRYGRFEDILPEDADRIVDINVKGVINGAYCGLPFLRRKPGACLVNVASSGAIYGGPDLAVYTATKFAVRGLSEALDAEFAPYGVEVRCIMPWFTETAMVRQPGAKRNSTLGEDFSRMGLHGPEVVADTIWDAVHGTKLHHPIGRQARAFAVFARLAPGMLRKSARKSRIKAAAGG